MNRVASFAILLVVLTLWLGGTLRAQEDTAAASATCNFDEEKQLVIQYQHVPIQLKKPINVQVPFGKAWAPGGKAMTLFTNTAVQVGSKELPVGAYTLFVIPNSKQWTLIVSKSTDTSGAYDQGQDLVRVPMDSGELPSPEASLSVSFAHISPQQCNIRIDLDKFGHFAEFKQK
jgi:DUF2911 family protein